MLYFYSVICFIVSSCGRFHPAAGVINPPASVRLPKFATRQPNFRLAWCISRHAVRIFGSLAALFDAKAENSAGAPNFSTRQPNFRLA
jgi:hypothetical protein